VFHNWPKIEQHECQPLKRNLSSAPGYLVFRTWLSSRTPPGAVLNRIHGVDKATRRPSVDTGGAWLGTRDQHTVAVSTCLDAGKASCQLWASACTAIKRKDV
jgi:hypothetical protein